MLMPIESWLYRDIKEDSEITYPKKKIHTHESLHKTQEQMAHDHKRIILDEKNNVVTKMRKEIQDGIDETNKI